MGLEIKADKRMDLLFTGLKAAGYEYVAGEHRISPVRKKVFDIISKIPKTETVENISEAISGVHSSPFVNFITLCTDHNLELRPDAEKIWSKEGVEVGVPFKAMTQFLDLLKKYSKEINFDAIHKEHIEPQAQKDLGNIKNRVLRNEPVQILKDYLNTKDELNLSILHSPMILRYEGFGPSKDNQLFSVSNYIGYDNKINLPNIFHESLHGVVNPLIERVLENPERFNHILNDLDEVNKEVYLTAHTAVIETIIRALEERIMQGIDEKEAELGVKSHLKQGFKSVPKVIEKLREFEKLRDTKGTTFAEFLPRIIKSLEKA